MQTQESNIAFQDEQAVAAVRRGEAERYRELVERHERRVFAVAWSRLGDAALAEDAVQEAFIRGYRRLWLLGDGAKFAAWISTIARHAAINLGLRHRRELNKRERWALEQPAASEAADESAESCTPEMLRQTLAQLPAAHRECLVLFYLEGKSGAEAAATLGISEAALRVRLHRARSALRERLEEKLAGSLEQLRPGKTLVPSIMAVVFASSSAKTATGGAAGAILAALAKFTPFKWLFAVVPLIFPAMVLLPAVLFQRWRLNQERKNFRDPEGFRARLHGKIDKRFFIFFPFFLALMIFLGVGLNRYFSEKSFFAVLGFCSAATALYAGRQLQINRSKYQRGLFFGSLAMSAAFIAVGLGWIPTNLVFIVILASSLMTISRRPATTARMDYNLFLRAAEGMLPESAAAASGESSIRFDRAGLLGFARFLGERWLVVHFKWKPDGLALRLPPVRVYAGENASIFFGFFTGKRSHLRLGWDGSVTAHCSDGDARQLSALRREPLSKSKLEEQVAAAACAAWRNFRNGNPHLAECALGQTPEEEIFIKPPDRLAMNRWLRNIIIGWLVLFSLFLAFGHFFRARLDGLQPVNLTEAQVRVFFSLVSTNPNPMVKTNIDGREEFMQKSVPGDPFFPLSSCLVLPETNLFTPRGLEAVRATVPGGGDLAAWRQNPQRVQRILYSSSTLHRALVEGWISWQDLNLQPADCTAFLHTNRFPVYVPTNWDRFLSRGESWSWVKSERFPVLRIQNWGVEELRFLREVNSLDLVDREKLIRQIAAVQVLSATPSPGQPTIHDWQDVRGLFFTPGCPALQDTYFSLAALEILGGLDRIDREACIRGILRRHEGRGYFTSPDSGSYNEYHIDGSAEDTIAAFESLRILGALDRVKDLDDWQFRPQRHGVPTGQITWHDIEAWTAQRRLEQILRERKDNPQLPVRSLREP